MRLLMKQFKKLLFAISILAICINAMAQNRKISGKIISAKDNSPVAGATVSVKGKTQSVAALADGSFSLNVPVGQVTLLISSVGFAPKEFKVDEANSNFIITLNEDFSKLSDVVVVGYGTQKKSDLTGSISSIKGADLTQIATQRVDQAIQGRAAGVFVLNTDGSPGGNMNSLNPNDIESIEILKDASATAIYGAQGANGVVLITTKLGKKGKPVIGYNYTYGSSKLSKKLDVMSAADYARTINAAQLTNNGSGNIPTPIFTDAQIAEYEKTGGTDWQDVIYRTAPLHNHELSISGGTDNLKYLVSTGYLNQKGILVNSEYERFSLRTNIKAEINDWASFGLNWFGSKETGNSPPFGSADISFLGNSVNVAPRWGATEPVYDEFGNYRVHSPDYEPADAWNPLASAIEPKIDNNTNRNNLNAYLEFRFLPGLSLKVTGGANITNVNNKAYHNLNTYEGRQNTGLGISSENTFNRYQNSNILTYDKVVEKHHFTFTGVAEQQYSKYKFSSIRASKFVVDATGASDLGGAGLNVTSSGAEERVLNSYLARINYVFDEKYLVTASYRADGSSVFGENNKWGYFPSASVAWRASQESFIRDLNIFSDLKLRGSWGITGNQAIDPYETLARVSSGANYPYNGGEGTELGYFIANAPNPNLKWESTTQTNVGIDFALFNGRLTVTADYYVKTTKDLLMPRTLPGYTGFTDIIDNVGYVENKGFEFTVGGDL